MPQKMSSTTGRTSALPRFIAFSLAVMVCLTAASCAYIKPYSPESQVTSLQADTKAPSADSLKSETSDRSQSTTQSTETASKSPDQTTIPANPQTSTPDQTTTAPSFESAHGADTTTALSDCTIILLELTSPIRINNTATIKVRGKPATQYTINVYYSTKASSAKGLEPKISDETGEVSWSWKVGASVKDGSYKITITDGTESFSTFFEVGNPG